MPTTTTVTLPQAQGDGPLAAAIALTRQHGGRVTEDLLAAANPDTNRMLRIVRSALIGAPDNDVDRILGELLTGPTNCRYCVHPDAPPVAHDLEDGQWWHVAELGTIPTRRNDLSDEVERRDAPLDVSICRIGDEESVAWLTIAGRAEGASLNLAGVRQAIAVLTVTERLLAADADGGSR
jgi:hypothetical protein